MLNLLPSLPNLVRHLLLLTSIALLPSCTTPEIADANTDIAPADTVILGAQIHTENINQPQATAIAVDQGKIVYVGDDTGAKKWIGAGTETLKLDGDLVLPGLVDGHTHAGILSLFASVEVVDTPNPEPEALLTWLQQYAANNPDLEFIVVGYFRTADFGLQGPHKALLDKAVNDRPVAIMDDSGHSMWLNSKALEVMGIDRNTPDPAPGLAFYQRDSNNEPTGWIKEFSSAPVQERILRTATAADLENNLEKFLQFLSSRGVTQLYDGGNLWLHDKVYSALSKLDRENRLPLHYEGTVHVHLPDQIDQAIPELKRLRQTYTGTNLHFNTVKIHFDGVHEISTSAVLQPFANDSSNQGGTLISQARLVAFIQQLHEEKMDLHLHVVGDRATRIALDAYEQAGAQHWDYPRLTLCHLELVDEADIPRFQQLGVVANFTPHWFGDLFQGGAETLGKRNHHKMRAKAFFDAGATVTFSSDVVVPFEFDRASPWVGMQIGHNRQDLEGGQKAPVMQPADQKLSLEQLVRGYTLNGAYQLRQDSNAGSLSVGKDADLVILDHNIFQQDPYHIAQTQALKTMLKGRFVYQKD
ncbi:amidohydrolase [Aestuariicella hydrocarbonica]|uniref:Amidohydrolase n=1 Tax=Pseudomaricurvus hydrocarbonicus TaxID=1470433 RepID=A0A9E5JWA2_9GAMM|nr:amidohydrolase [Aestuariicella hydrocarbonica]NHO65741.1 amidohydrolase [Aestuariicella hydrocarbonica]